MIGRAVNMRQARRVAPVRREMSIERALVWAFQTECASVDFAEEAAPDSYRRAISSAWLVAQRGAIGCRIDGGGHSLPADDAEMIASAVAALPPEHGGRGMAVQVASLARIGARPDWMPGARQRCVPVDRSMNQHGWQAATSDAASLGVLGWPPMRRRSRKGSLVEEPVRFCPVTYTPTAAQIAKSRRAYLDWWGALLHVGSVLRTLSVLESIIITRDMPPLTPWRSVD